MTATSQISRRGTARVAIALSGAAVAATLASPAHAAAPSAKTTFYGHCAIVGTDVASDGSSYFRGHGVCVGSLDGATTTSHRVVEIIREHGVISPDYFGLPAVHGASNGVGQLTFGHQTVRFVIQHSLASFTIEGALDGIGSGSATALPEGKLRLAMSTCGTSLVG